MLSKTQLRLVQALHLKKQRDLRREFIAEGIKTVLEIAGQHPELVKTLYGTARFLKQNENLFREKNIHTELVEEEELQKISLQKQPNETLAVCNYLPEHPVSDPGDSFNFFLDDLRDPGNMGTIIRLCAWFGISTLYCSPSSCDLYNPKVIQSTMGAFLRVKVVYISLNELLRRVTFGQVYGAVLDGKDIFKQHLERGLILIGNEANGISTEGMSRITQGITIPAAQSNGTESLNAAIAASIVAAEFFRRLGAGKSLF